MTKVSCRVCWGRPCQGHRCLAESAQQLLLGRHPHRERPTHPPFLNPPTTTRTVTGTLALLLRAHVSHTVARTHVSHTVARTCAPCLPSWAGTVPRGTTSCHGSRMPGVLGNPTHRPLHAHQHVRQIFHFKVHQGEQRRADCKKGHESVQEWGWAAKVSGQQSEGLCYSRNAPGTLVLVTSS